jgi:gas vesicle protein
MDKQNQNKHSNTGIFFNGFIIGLLVGAGIVLLLTTKKGKRILKSLTEEGFDKISNIDDLMKRFEKVTEQVVSDGDDEEAGNDYVKEKPVLLAIEPQEQPVEKKTVTLPPIQINTTGDELKSPEPADEALLHIEALRKKLAQDLEDAEDQAITTVKSTRRRFFRGIPKRA